MNATSYKLYYAKVSFTLVNDLLYFHEANVLNIPRLAHFSGFSLRFTLESENRADFMAGHREKLFLSDVGISCNSNGFRFLQPVVDSLSF